MYYQDPTPLTVTNLIPRDNPILVAALDALHRELDVAIEQLMRQAEAGQAKLAVLRAAKIALGDASIYENKPVQTSARAAPVFNTDAVRTGRHSTGGKMNPVIKQARVAVASAEARRAAEAEKSAIRRETMKQTKKYKSKVYKDVTEGALRGVAGSALMLNKPNDPRRNKKTPPEGTLGSVLLARLIADRHSGEFVPASVMAFEAGTRPKYIGNIIARLRRLGYSIEAAPKSEKNPSGHYMGGYRLTAE